MKRIGCILCALCLLCGCLSGCGNGKRVTVYDMNGGVIATLSKQNFSAKELADPGYRSCVEYALNEAAAALATINQCSVPDALKALFTQGYDLRTTIDPAIHDAVGAMYSRNTNLHLGCAVTDLNGNIRAIYSGGSESYALGKYKPFSTIKPLSVYGPAIENGVMDWSTKIVDKPYKQVKDEDGKRYDWPVNPSQGYTYKKTSLMECIRQSLNTAAVHGLKSVGIKESIHFLQNSFGMDLAYEQNKLTIQGEDEVVGNVALGYLYAGVTPVELAGYYQVFGNGGQYTAPHAVTEILDKSGQTVYTHESETKQIFRADTAYIMNRLLSSVVTTGGTGSKAKVKGTELIGKTGTGNEEGGNWFVGVTPEYSCAIWHAVSETRGNVAATLYTQIMEKMPTPTKKTFPTCAAVRKGVYCSDSGKLFSSACNKIQIGYYATNRKPATCDAH